MQLSLTIGKDWTLFLDRDGVINHEKRGDYIRNPDEFFFYDGVPEALALLSGLFATIVVVTNQKGVGKGLMTLQDLADIHRTMLDGIAEKGGRIDKVYFCPDLDAGSPDRKPNPGMAFRAKADFPSIDFDRSIMVGNKLSDMGFGRNAGMKTVFLATTDPETPFPHPDIDHGFDTLADFANALRKA